MSPTKRSEASTRGRDRGLATPAEQVGLLFRRARESQRLSQDQLAALTGGRPGRVSRAMISAVERGRHLPGLEVLLTLSRVLHVSPSEVLERIELARADAVEDDRLSLEQLDRAAGRSFWAGEHRRAVAYYDAMLRRLGEPPADDGDERRRWLATTELRRGTALRRCGALVSAKAALERSIGMTDDLPAVQSQAYLVYAALMVQLGCLPLARDASRRAVEIAERLDDPKLTGWAWIERGEVLAASGRPAEARRAFLDALRMARRAGDREHEIKLEGNLGACLQDMQRPDQARRHYPRAVRLARDREIAASEALWLVELARLEFRQGRSDESERYAAAALRLATPEDQLLTCFRAEWWRHELRLAERASRGDRHRLAYLRRLYVRLEEYRGIEEVGEFRRRYCST